MKTRRSNIAATGGIVLLAASALLASPGFASDAPQHEQVPLGAPGKPQLVLPGDAGDASAAHDGRTEAPQLPPPSVERRDANPDVANPDVDEDAAVPARAWR